MADLTIRALDPDADDLQAWMSAAWLALTFDARPTPEWVRSRLPSLRGQRPQVAVDGGLTVGTYRSWDTRLSVPGGSVTADAISSVGVVPTHRRRGALTGMIRSDLRDAADRGVPVAVLIASEATIYSRFGFGPATESGTWRVDLRSAAVRDDAPTGCTVRLADAEEICRLGPGMYEGSRRSGDIDRMEDHWQFATGAVARPGDSGPAPAGVLATDPSGAPQGYLLYSTTEQWDDRVINTSATLHDLRAATPEAYAALWRCVVGLDLVATLRADDRAVDEALPWLLVDRRAARLTSTCDFLWTRLLDPAVALSARNYSTAAPADVVLEVLDPDGPAGGVYALEIDADGTGNCRPSRSSPHVRIPLPVLSALWLGGGTLVAAAASGRAAELRAGGVERLSRLLHTPSTPWSSTWF